MTKLFEIELSAKQMQALSLLNDAETVKLLYGGAKGGGKTVLGCKYAFYFAKNLAQVCNVKKSKFPPVIGFLGRKRSVDFTNTTLNTWKRDIPYDAYEIKKQEKLLIIENRVAFQFGGLDDTETIKKFNSAEYALVWIDQPEECSEKDIGMLQGTMRLKVNGIQPDYKMLLTCNPPIGDDPDFYYLKRDFIDIPKKGNRFLKALYTDNPFLPSNYGETLDQAYSFNPDLLSAYKFGEWDRIAAANVIIPSKVVKENVNNTRVDNDNFKRRVTVCDIAGGDDDGTEINVHDETVIYDLENGKIIDQEIYSHRDEMDTVGRVIAHQRKHGSSVVCIDKVGLGAGCYSRLKEVYKDYDGVDKIFVYGFDSRISAPDGIDDETYANYKTYAWFNASKKYFREFKCYLPDDPVLLAQLSAMTFYFKSGGKMACTPKSLIKSKLGCSPDRAEAYIMGLDALKYAKTKLVTDRESGWNSRSFVPEIIHG